MQPQHAQSAIDLLLQLGLPGVAILVLGFVALRLYNQLLAQQDKYNALQEKRHEEMKLVASQYHEAMSESAKATEELARAIGRGGG
jgi:uncharacterized membrane-anchored protein YhcB (DUF1043 family)